MGSVIEMQFSLLLDLAGIIGEWVCRWVKICGTELLPGDVVSVGRSSVEDKSVPADMLILAGSAIVNEAILTGESTPQWKVGTATQHFIIA